MLQLKKISKTFNEGTVNEKKVLKQLDFRLEKGEFVTIIGSNGAGKSTLFNLISGVELPDIGSITLENKDITFMPEHKRAKNIGRLFQDPLKGTAPSMTIEENLAIAYMRGANTCFRVGISKKQRSLFREKLALLDLGLEDRMSTKMGLLSGGQRQAVTLLMSTLITPTLLLLDEHTAALDPATAEKVLNLTQVVVEENNISTMMITHNMQSALELGTRTIMMHEGSIILDVKGEERKAMDVDKLLRLFKEQSHEALDNDRILLA